jgi:hypothetical protein
VKKRGDQQNRYFPFPEFIQVVIPVVVFDPEYQGRVDSLYELFRIHTGRQRQIKNVVSTFIMLHHFVTGRRKKGDDNTIPGIFLPERFEQKSPLFKFSQRRAMQPNHFPFFPLHGFLYVPDDIFPPFQPQSRLWVPH